MCYHKYMNLLCTSCKTPVLDTYYFCPMCGKKLKDKPLSTSIFKQLGIYAFAFFFPPFGLIPAIKYLKQNNQTTRIIGLVIVIITIISVVLTVWWSLKFFATLQTSLNQQLPSELNLYR